MKRCWVCCHNTFIAFLFLVWGMIMSASVSAEVNVRIGMLRLPVEETRAVPEYLREPENNGEAGAKLSIKDANGTGKFLGQKYSL
ncbi:hypothetical protein SAMN02745132_00501 [Enterovibrio nigricans DSM 22720]|uniref:Uncharacterized protein n=2 Tax=Enterovibrio nigricans TaxID=504469 RepID=A0A1T4U0S9_9GAMM|nr:hypothetical protein SAMN02745132_00501 [Enterovibrio nigricans DSM 22720]